MLIPRLFFFISPQNKSQSLITFFSLNHLFYIKKSLVLSRFFMVCGICDDELVDRELDVILESFPKLGYPRFFVNQIYSFAKWNIYSHSRYNDSAVIYYLFRTTRPPMKYIYYKELALILFLRTQGRYVIL